MSATPSPDPLLDPGRLQALRRSGLLDGESAALDRYTSIVRAALDVPIACVTFVTDREQIFRGAIGFDVDSTPLEHSVCARVVRAGVPFRIDDLSRDERTRDLPVVPGLGVVAYAADPLRSPAGLLGTLTVMDTAPRVWSEQDQRLLSEIASSVETELDLVFARLREKDRREWAALESDLYARALDGEPLPPLLREMAARLCDRFPGSATVIRLDISSRDSAPLLVTAGMSEELERLFGEALHDPDGRPWSQMEDGPHVVGRDGIAEAWDRPLGAALLEDGGFSTSVSAAVRGRAGRAFGSVTLFTTGPIPLGIGLTDGLEQAASGIRPLVEHERGRRAIAESEEKLSLALASSSAGFFDWWVQEDRLEIGDGWYRMLGLDPDGPEVGGIGRWRERLHPDDAAEALTRLDAVLAGESSSWEVEHRLRHADGGWTWTLTRGTVVLRDEEGRPLRMIGIQQDVTERHRRAHAFERLSAAVDHLNDAVVITDVARSLDDDPVIRFVNPALGRLLGIDERRTVGMTTAELFARAKGDREALLEARGRLLAGERGPIRRLLQFGRPDGSEVWADVLTQPIPASEGVEEFWVSVARDVTERIETERELTVSREQIRHAQKMEAVGRLAGGMAHDFNNLLTAIIGYGEFIELEANDPGMRDDAREIVSAATRGQSITRALLAFSRKNPWSSAVLEVDSLLSGTGRLIERMVGEDVVVQLLPSSDRLWIESDFNQLEQALLNLTINARDALPQGGSIILSAEEVTLPEPLDGHPETIPAGRWVRLRVEDDGTGIEPELLPHIFEPFFTTKEAGRGTGLGLASVYGVVKQSQGWIRIESLPGKGTTVSLHLPPAEAPASETPERPDPDTGLHGTETILVVEDEVQVRNLTVRALRRYGYGAIEAKHGRDALLVWEAHADEIDLVLTDVVMPEMGGAALAGALAELAPELPVLFMSGYTGGTTGGREARPDIPAADLVSKPFTHRELISRVRQRLDRVEGDTVT